MQHETRARQATKGIISVAMGVCLMVLQGQARGSESKIDISGEWRFQLDPADRGIKEAWYDQMLLDTIDLPGSTDLGGKSIRPDEPVHGRLMRLHKYVGAAWYQREMTIPESWNGKNLELFLERCHWVSDVWINDTHVGSDDSLSVPHRYDVSSYLTPGPNTITIRIDNTPRYGISEFTSSITEHSQSNWNGIIGRIELRARPKVYVHRVRTTTVGSDLEFTVSIANSTDSTVPVFLEIRVANHEVTHALMDSLVHAEPGITHHNYTMDAIPLWDEFEPYTADYVVSMMPTEGDNKRTHSYEGILGARHVSRDDAYILINGDRRFLRGTLEAALHPKTGHPPMDVDRWRGLFDQVKTYGMNHVRFHAWCPPQAAFEAADEMGMYIQAEAPWWGRVEEEGADDRMDFLRREAQRILDEYGNHPSFILFSMGNELGQPHGPYLSETIEELRKNDPRRLYTTASGHFIPRSFDEAPFVDDFFVSLATPDGILRGQARFDAAPPDTTFDYQPYLANIDRPLIIHELGQWAMFPDLAEADKYTGPLRHVVYERAESDLQQRGMQHLNKKFTDATGAFLVELTKEEIESAMRTRDLAGFQMLGLSDQAGWGTAVIGLLDAYWEDKGLIVPEEFRQFCGPTLPLLQLPKRVWREHEHVEAGVLIHHFGPAAHTEVDIYWEVRDNENLVRDSGRLPVAELAKGGNTSAGSIAFPVEDIGQSEEWIIRLWAEDPAMENTWRIWVYPDSLDVTPSEEIVVTESWTTAAAALRDGGRVLYRHASASTGHVLPGKFTPIFWAFAFNPTNTFGLLVDPDHPALTDFATDVHSDWQWWELMQGPAVFILDEMPRKLHPIIRVVDSFHRNQNLGVLFEARVGPGQLLATSLDVLEPSEDHPVRNQLRNSLLAYIESDRFVPSVEVSQDQLGFLFSPYAVNEYIIPPPDPSLLEGADLMVHTAAGQTLEVSSEEQADSAAGTDALVPLSYGFREMAESDWVRRQQDGFAYRLTDMEGPLATDWFWIDHKPILQIHTPPAYEGTLYLHFVDWNNLGRRTRLRFEGRMLGDISGYDGGGTWLALPIKASDTKDGSLALNMTTINGGNTLLRAFAVSAAGTREN